jgi:hypothetical protein
MHPRIERPQKPDPTSSAELAAEMTVLREAHQNQVEAAAPIRRAVLAAGPALRDIEAAVTCHCSCHPRPAETTLHDGGSTCPCQQTPEERRSALESLLETFEEFAPSAQEQQEREQRIEQTSSELDIELDAIGGGAPFVIRGRVDGRAFVLRERHDHWTVRIAGDENPGACPWTGGPDMTTILVAEGDSEQFAERGSFDELRALRTAVDAVRLFLLRRICTHDRSGRYCQDCGVAISDAELWRIHTNRD